MLGDEGTKMGGLDGGMEGSNSDSVIGMMIVSDAVVVTVEVMVPHVVLLCVDSGGGGGGGV
jgi:hypothetical protein